MEKDAQPADVRYSLVQAYDTDDPEFFRGAEIGYLEAKVELLGGVAIREVMRRSNEEMVRRVSEGAGRGLHVEAIDSEWMEVTLEPASPSGSKEPRQVSQQAPHFAHSGN